MTVSYTNRPTVLLYGTNENRNDAKNTAIDRYFRKPLSNWRRHDALQLPPNMVAVSMVTSVHPLQRCSCIGYVVNRKNRNCSPQTDACPIVCCCCWMCWMVHAATRYSAVSWHCDSPSMWDIRRTLTQDW